jgi:thioredoxin 1
MSAVKRYAVCLLFCLLIALGIGAEIARGDEPAPVLLDFYSDWCGPCQAMSPTVDALARAGYTVRRINIDQNADLARQFGVTSIPCFVAVVEGAEVDRVVGQCSYERLEVMVKRRPAKIDVRVKSKVKEPKPAWRYERPDGYRAAVVRVYCQIDAKSRAIGSGTLVKWGGKIVVLTARHVVKDAKEIVVQLHNQRAYKARVVAIDAVWDCAVLELSPAPIGAEAVEVELGQDAMQREGNRLESCGYGPDGKLACNTGLFIGYRRSSLTPKGPDDWMIISGHARSGDSGGGVFNARGRLVGVLWGTDGKEVVCVQAGRIHALLDEAANAYQQQAILDRNPTPPRPGPLAQVPQNCGPGCDCSPMPGPEPYELYVPTARDKKKDKPPVLPWRADEEAVNRAQAEQIDKLIELERLRAANSAKPARDVSVNVQAPEKNAEKKDDASPLIAGICILGAIVLGFVLYFALPKK